MRFEAPVVRRAFAAAGLAIFCSLPSVVADAGPASTPPQESVAQYPWTDAFREETLAKPPYAGRAVLIDASADVPSEVKGKVLRISADASEPLSLRLLTVPNPPITADFYALAGQVKYEGVQGNQLMDAGYLEMWSTFPGASQGERERSFFSRTLGELAGDPMQSFHGTSSWRPVLLPFNAASAGAKPASLTVDLVLPAGGTVYLAPFHLSQFLYGPGRAAAASGHGARRQDRVWPLASVAAVFLVAAGTWGVWYVVNRRRAAEWRRMAAHDASTR